MGISDLHTFVEAECSNACVSVDLLKISRGFQKTNSRVEIPNNNCHCGLVIDAECCLDRLYGGFFSDWVCGGQFNRMTDFLKSLIDSCQNANLDFVVFFNGALEKEKLNDWFVQQKLQKENIRHVFRHIITKGTPPPKVLWNAPVFLQGALRMALANLKVSVECSVEDHHQEIIAFCRKHALQGIVAQNPLYVIFDPPRYFSANNLKLTYKGSLETTEYIVDEIAKCLNLNPNRFCIFAALLGNHILTDNDLHDFRCQFPNDAHIGNRVTTKLDAAMIKITCDFVRNLQSVSNLDQVGDLVFQNCQPADKHLLIGKFKQSVQYYQEGTSGSFLKYRSRFKTPGVSRLGAVLPNSSIPNNSIPNSSIPNGAFTKDSCTRVQPEATNAADAAPVTDFVLPAVMDDIIRIARERHQRGLMHPKIYQVLTEGEVRLPVVLEDDNSSDLPSYVDLYRPLRQSVYSILFNLNKLKIVHEQSCKAKGVDAAARSFEVFVREWVVRKGLSGPTCEFTVARPVDWKVPSIERMWLGLSEDDRLRRLRAFLTVMRSDTPFILAGLLVPQHMLLMVCVLRYILHHGHVLQSAELNAFLAMATSPLLNDVQTVQDVKLPDVTVRGVHLATLFMSGVEMAVMANDVCGAPVPVGMCCPWLFFNGKLLHYKLLKANSPLIDLCDGQVEQVLRVEKMRQVVLQNMRVDFARPALLPVCPPPYTNPPVVGHCHPTSRVMTGRGRGMLRALPRMPGICSVGQAQGILGHSPVDIRGGRLEIAGVVVGSWGGRKGHLLDRFQKMVNVAADDQITGDVFHDMKDDSDGEGVEEWCV